MANGIRTDDPRGFNKGRSSKFREVSRVRQTPEEGRRIYRPKRCGNNNKVEDNRLKTFNDKKPENLLLFFRLFSHRHSVLTTKNFKFGPICSQSILLNNEYFVWEKSYFLLTITASEKFLWWPKVSTKLNVNRGSKY